MPKEFEDIESLAAWNEAHKDLGLVNGQEVFSEENKEIQVTIAKSLYDRTLLIARTLGFSKTDAGKSALKFWSENFYIADLYSQDLRKSHAVEPSRQLRFYAPLELLPGDLSVVDSDFISLVMYMWTVQEWKLAEAKIKDRAIALGITFEECCDKIFASWKKSSRLKRLEKSKSEGKLDTSPKML